MKGVADRRGARGCSTPRHGRASCRISDGASRRQLSSPRRPARSRAVPRDFIPRRAFVLSGGLVARLDDGATLRTRSSALDRITKREPHARQHDAPNGHRSWRSDLRLRRRRQRPARRAGGSRSSRVRRISSSPRICNAHGTAVAGAAAGATLGVAPEAEIVDVKIINCDHMRGSVGAIVDAARWTVQDHRRHPGQPAIANWSFAVDTTRNVPEVDSAMVMLRDAGMLVVVAAGNFDIDACHVSPANAPRALVVGASALVRSSGTQREWQDVRARTPRGARASISTPPATRFCSRVRS